MTTEAATPAAAPATPAAEATATPATPTAQAAPAPGASLLDAAAAAKETPKAPEAPPAEQPTWFYGDGTPGKGEAPAWYLADKYKTVEEQAKAYPELQKRLGAFKGAPPDGKYEFKAPEGSPIEWVADHPLVSQFQKWAAEKQLSQEGYQELMGMLTEYEAAQLPDMAQIEAEIGDNARERVIAVEKWARANLDGPSYEMLRQATATPQAAVTFKTLEAIIAKTTQASLPKPGADVVAAVPGGQAGIRHLMEAKDKDGRIRYFTDEAYRADVDKKTREYHAALAKAS